MLSDINLRFHNGQEFTMLDDPHGHCIVMALVPETASYDIIHTASGTMQRFSEKDQMELYVPSTVADKTDALSLLGSRSFLVEQRSEVRPALATSALF
jgi:hypothetical protein